MRMNTKRLVYCALLTAIALTIFMVEAQLPPITPIPGMKLGLANIVTVYAMFALGPGNTLLILLCRIVLSSLFAGGSTIFYSLAGGLLCAIFHNIGQIGAAIAIYQVPQLIVYLPFLLVVGIIAGAFTGLAAQFLLARIGDKIKL